MAYGLMLRLMLAGFTFTVAVSQSENDDSEVLACRLTSKLQRAESTSDAQITAILEYKFTQIEYEGAIQCRLEGLDGTVQYVPFSVVILHDPPTELRVAIPMALRAKLEASTMICRYADIGPDRHVNNEIPDTAKPTEKNGVYKCGEGTDFQIVLTELLENSAKPRQKRMDKNLICSRFGTKSDQDAPAIVDEAGYCDMFNGTAGVKMFTEKDGYQCSQCCPNHVFNIKKMMCEPCPAHSHRKGYSYFGECFPGDPSDQTQPPSNPRNEPSIQFKEPVDRNTTFVSIAWVLSGERSLFSHFQVVMERKAISPREFETDETFLNFTNLTPDTLYHFTVTAVPVAVEKGKDLKSKVLKVQTLFVIPTVEDLNVVVTNGKARVTWKPQPDYRLKLVLNCSREESEVPCNKKTHDHVVRVSKGRFSFELRCEGVFNLRAHYYDLQYARHGPESDSLKFIFKQKPKSAPTELMEEANTTSALIKWERVLSSKENPIKYYAIYYNNEGTTDTVVHTKDNKTFWKLEALTPNTEYEVCVAAVNSEGEGPCSSPHSFQTFFVIPNISGISVNMSNDQIYVSWKPQEKFNVSVQITCTFNGSTPEVWHMNDWLGKFDFNLRSYGKYDIVIQYSDENTDREGPPTYEETFEYSGSSQLGTIIAVVVVVVFIGIIAGVICRNRSKLSSRR